MDVRRRSFVVACLVVLLLPALAVGQEESPKPITWASFVTAEEGQSQALNALMSENPVYESLMEQGHILAWGVAQPINHTPSDGFTHVEWVTFRDWAGIEAFIQAFFAAQAAKTPEQMASEEAAWQAATVHGSHWDSIFRHVDFHTAGAEGPRPQYLSLSYYRARPGEESKVADLYGRAVAPVFQELMAEGVVGGYGLAVEELHSDPSWTHMGWSSMSSLASQDTIDAAFAAADAARSEDETKEIESSTRELFEPGSHWDRILVNVHLGGGGEG